MTTIYKYPILPKTISAEWRNEISLELPVGAKILKIETQHNIPCIWVMVDTLARTETRNFEFYGTGQEMKEPTEDLIYIGTWFMSDRFFVFHLFERK
jgi:hypothetical protein